MHANVHEHCVLCAEDLCHCIVLLFRNYLIDFTNILGNSHKSHFLFQVRWFKGWVWKARLDALRTQTENKKTVWHLVVNSRNKKKKRERLLPPCSVLFLGCSLKAEMSEMLCVKTQKAIVPPTHGILPLYLESWGSTILLFKKQTFYVHRKEKRTADIWINPQSSFQLVVSP